MMVNLYHASADNKEARVAVLILGKDFRASVTRDKEGHFMMIKSLVHQRMG